MLTLCVSQLQGRGTAPEANTQGEEHTQSYKEHSSFSSGACLLALYSKQGKKKGRIAKEILVKKLTDPSLKTSVC